MTNWKTTALGIATIIGAVSGVCVALFDGNPATNIDWALTSSALTGGFGLIFAKDKPKT